MEQKNKVYHSSSNYNITKKYVVEINNDKIIENVILLDTQLEPQTKLFEGFDELDFSTSNDEEHFCKILLYLNSGQMLIHKCIKDYGKLWDSVYKEYNSLEIVNLNLEVKHLISSKNPGRYYGLFNCKIDPINDIQFHHFENVICSPVLYKTYIVFCDIMFLKKPENFNSKQKFDNVIDLIDHDENIFKIYNLYNRENELYKNKK
jgi:hypothetical protein